MAYLRMKSITMVV